MRIHILNCLIYLAALVVIACTTGTTHAQDAAVGEFTGHTDVGSPKNPGGASYNAETQEYSLKGSGINMWANSDQFQFAWKKIKGDFIVRARVEFIGKGVEAHRKIGWIARPSLNADSPYADAAVHGAGLTSLQYRTNKAGVTAQTQLAILSPDIIQFERRGSNYLFSAAHSGEPFTNSASLDLDLGDELYVGLFICAHNSNVTEQAVVRDVRIIRPAPANFVPYHDYIGSTLEILEVDSGRLQTIHSSAQPFEAPNWTPDGSALIYNTSGLQADWRGRLIHFDLATRKPTIIETGANNRLNNDHVLSFDGSMIGISDNSLGGQSAVYTLPATGGTPKRITLPLGPSYLHGWSPDGKFLVFTGGRSNVFDIYRIVSNGTNQEVRLTDGTGLNDGPEYTPDGKYIYFCSTRTGRMQIWRMKPDGSGQEQITNDDYNNWFPHISPDGQRVAFITFPKDITPTDHPYYKQVYLRIMPLDGGPPKVIAYVYGGQGTINVPSWSPDSKKIAFVSNSGME